LLDLGPLVAGLAPFGRGEQSLELLARVLAAEEDLPQVDAFAGVVGRAEEEIEGLVEERDVLPAADQDGTSGGFDLLAGTEPGGQSPATPACAGAG